MDGTDPSQPVAAPESRLGKDISAPDALQIIARNCIQQIKAAEPALQDRSPEALHQVRVALRQWRTALALFGDLLTDAGRKLQIELKWLAGQLNEARDLDVFAPSLVSHRRSGRAELDTALDQARSRAYERVSRALHSNRARRLLWEGVRPVRATALTLEDEAPRARVLVAKWLSRQRRRLAKDAPRMARLNTASRHKLRIRAKKARYAAELFADLFGHKKRQGCFTRSLKQLQDALGELNDIHISQVLAARLAREADSVEAGFEAGLIAGSRTGGEKTLLKRAGKAYGRFAAVEPFW